MGRLGQKSLPVSIRLPEGIVAAIDREVETYREESSRAEFIQDAVKFYLRFKGERHGTFYFAEKSSEKQSEEPRLYQSAFLAVLAGL